MIEVTNTHILDNLYPIVEANLSDAKNTRDLQAKISKYADKWAHVLLSLNLHERLLFSDSDKKILFEICGVDEAKVKKVIHESVAIKSNWKVATNPFYVLSILVLRYYHSTNNKQMFSIVALYLSYPLYTSSHFASFKFLPTKEKMDYTINHLSNRFIIKQHGTIQGMIEYTTLTALEGRYVEELERCTDEDIKDIIYAIETRIGFNIKNIAEEFYENNKNEKVIFSTSDNLSEEDYHIADNKSFAISRIADAVTRNIVETGMDANTIIRKSANLNAGVSQKKLTMLLNNLIEQDRNSIHQFITDIVTIFINKSGTHSFKDVGSNKFLSEMLQHYKGNSQDELTSRVKAKVLYWIDIACKKYGNNFISRGKTQLDGYRRAIFCSFIFKIMETVK